MVPVTSTEAMVELVACQLLFGSTNPRRKAMETVGGMMTVKLATRLVMLPLRLVTTTL